MNARPRLRLAFLSMLAALGLGACMIAAGPAATFGPPPATSASAAPPAEARFEDNTWRPGGDLRTFKLPQGGPQACADACQREPACYAYSYVKPEYQSHGVGECSLKHNVPLASKNACCVSGVIRAWP